jgi:hypothetical protein
MALVQEPFNLRGGWPMIDCRFQGGSWSIAGPGGRRCGEQVARCSCGPEPLSLPPFDKPVHRRRDPAADISAAYTRFADDEVQGRSSLYEEFARGVACDPEVIAFLLTMPRAKRQPNLLFAALRYVCGTPTGWHQFRRALMENRHAVRAIMLERSTQTNEPARCATLLPVLAKLPQPLALIEVGASAGLCLLPDLYGYDYGARIVRPEAAQRKTPIFPCTVSAATPVPTTPPRVV